MDRALGRAHVRTETASLEKVRFSLLRSFFFESSRHIPGSQWRHKSNDRKLLHRILDRSCCHGLRRQPTVVINSVHGSFLQSRQGVAWVIRGRVRVNHMSSSGADFGDLRARKKKCSQQKKKTDYLFRDRNHTQYESRHVRRCGGSIDPLSFMQGDHQVSSLD